QSAHSEFSQQASLSRTTAPRAAADRREVKTGSWGGDCLPSADPPRADVHLPVGARSSPLPEPEQRPGGGGSASASSISTGHAAELLGAGPSGPNPRPLLLEM